MELAPIILFTYNRVGHTRDLIESLKRNREADMSRLYIYSDGAKNADDEVAVNEVRQYIEQIDGFAAIDIVKSETNRGLANSVIAGVTQVVNQHGKVIVLEDDLVVAPYFLQFMNDALSTYEDEERVGHIQACDFTQDPSLPPTFFIKWTGSWGWATWKRAWKLFNPDGKQLLAQLEEQKLTRTFDFDGNYPYTRMLRRQIAGQNNSWAIRWNASLFLNNVLSLNVGRSLVNNNGFDGSGTNCGGGDLYQSNLWLEPLPVEKISPIEENMDARRAFARYYHRTNGFWAKVRRRLMRTLKGDFGK